MYDICVENYKYTSLFVAPYLASILKLDVVYRLYELKYINKFLVSYDWAMCGTEFLLSIKKI